MMSTNKKTKINPVCLPESSFPDEDQVGFVTGLGLKYQQTCRTNGGGPEMYKRCAPGKIPRWNFHNLINPRYEKRRQVNRALRFKR